MNHKKACSHVWLPVRHRTDSPWRTCPFRQLAEKLFARLQSKWPCRPLWRVAGKLPLPRRGGFQSALLVGGLETAAPCVGASRLTHVSPLIAYTPVAAYRWVAPGV